MSGHAKLSASSSSRWLNCTASTKFMDKSGSSDASDYGTLLHYLAELKLTVDYDITGLLGKRFNIVDGGCVVSDSGKHVVDEIMIDTVFDYGNYTDAVSGDFYEVEMRYDLSGNVGYDCGGTCDFVSIDKDTNSIHIIDLKTGRVEVSPENNTQLMIYALGAFYSLSDRAQGKDWTFYLHIYQPLINNIGFSAMTKAELLKFGDRLKKAVDDIKSGNLSYTPSEAACKYCPNNSNCKALNDKVYASIYKMLEVDPGNVDGLSLDDVAKVKVDMPLIETFLKAIEKRVFMELSSGNEVLGFKLVQGRPGNRQWAVEYPIEALVDMGLQRDEIAIEMIAPLSVVDRVAKTHGADISGLFSRPEGKPIVVGIDDKRPAIRGVCDVSEFD